MTASVHRFVGNHRNLIRNAILSASALRPSEDLRQIASDAQGNGRLTLTGPYTGATDSVIDVEVLSTAIGAAPQISAPAFQGIGSGSLEVIDVDPLAVAQTMTLTLADMGDPDRFAELDFYGATLRAKEAGAAGNTIELTVDRGGITETALPFSILREISAGTSSLSGPEWDFNAPAGAGGNIPNNAPRIRFAGFPQVHRTWKEWKAGEWVYRLDPAPAYRIPADVGVLQITGDYEITVEKGLVTEVYDAVTVYGFLRALQSRSALLDVIGAVAEDRAPGGMAATDIPLRTDAHALPPTNETKPFFSHNLRDVEILNPAAPTENLTVAWAGNDVWAVRGGVSGDLPAARTGVPYTGGPVGFTVPELVIPPTVNAGEINALFQMVSRDADEPIPAVCFKPLRLGAAARSKTVTFTYKRKPLEDCVCDNMADIRLKLSCLGLIDGGATMALDPEFKSRLMSLYAWRKSFITGNVGFRTHLGDTLLGADAVDVELADRSASVFAECLEEVYDDATARTAWDAEFSGLQALLLPFAGAGFTTGQNIFGSYGLIANPWSQDTTVSAGTYIRPRAGDEVGHVFLVTQGGSTGATEPDWEAAILSGDPVLLEGANIVYEIVPAYWTPTTVLSLGDTTEPGNGEIYRVKTAGTTGADEPFWSTTADITDGTVVWERLDDAITGAGGNRVVLDQGAFTMLNSYTKTPGSSNKWVVRWRLYRGGRYTGAEATGYQEDLNAAHEEAKAKLEAVKPLYTSEPGTIGPFITMWQAQMDHVRTIAGIVPKSSASSIAGDGCWQDCDGSHWWVDESGQYLPICTNEPYHSARRVDGEARSTQEFGVGVVTPCPERLKEGDRIVITIQAGGVNTGYSEGDRFIFPVIGAAAKSLGGGHDGNPTQTWAVSSSETGALTDYAFNPASPSNYTAGPIDVRLHPGGIPFEEGDRFSLAVEGGELRWRRDGGSWTTEDIGSTITVGDGLSLVPVRGHAPSYVDGDTWQFRARATHGVDRLRQPVPGRAMAWDSASVTLDADLGSAKDIDALVVALHTIPAGATVTLSGGLAGYTEWTEAVDVAGVIFHEMDRNARYLRLAITGTPSGGSIGWWWAGVPWAPSGASSVVLGRQYGIARGTGRNPAAIYHGRGQGGRVSWDYRQGAWLNATELAELEATLDHVVEQGLEPIVFLPNIEIPGEAALVQIDTDSVQVEDFSDYQNEDVRAYGVELPLRGVLS